MKSLKESILSSNNAGIASTIRDILADYDKFVDNETIDELNRLWDKIGLHVPGFRWIKFEGRSFEQLLYCKGYINKESKWDSLIKLIYRPSSSTEEFDLVVHLDLPKSKLSKKKIQSYSLKICDFLHMSIDHNGATYVKLKFE